MRPSFRLRTAGDALYPTDLAPWSRYSDRQLKGKLPMDSMKPLEMDDRGNPQTGHGVPCVAQPVSSHGQPGHLTCSPNNMTYYQHPDWIIKYGKKNYYYDPGLPEVREKFNQHH